MVSSLFPACSTLSGFQEAQVAGKGGEFSALMGITGQAFNRRGGGNPFYDNGGEAVPSANFGFRKALGDRFEAGVLVFSMGETENPGDLGWGLEGKAQALDGERFDFSFQFGFRRATVALADRDYDVRLNDVFAGGLITWTLSPSARLTLAPRVINREYTPFNVTPAFPSPPSDQGTLRGGILTISLGKKLHVLPEIGWFQTDGVEILHMGLGLSEPF